MLLTAGTFLQEGRYWVEGILEQDETGISYRAQHRNLDISVVIQTFGPAVSQRPDAPQILQSFMAEVRHQSLAPSPDKPFRVLDCFIEFSQPFVVLEMAPDAKPPGVAQTWLAGLSESPVQEPSVQEQPVDEVAVTPPSLPELASNPPVLEAPAGVPTNGNTSSPTGKGSVTTVTQVVAPKLSKNGTKPATHVLVSAPGRRSPRWLPISLGITAVIGGCAGAVFGWQLRQGKSLSQVVPVVGPKVDIDQSFPPIEGWPASKASDIPGSGADLDQVLQRQPTERKARPRHVVEEPRIEPYQIDYGSNTRARSEPYREPDYNSDSFDGSAPADNYQDEAPAATEPTAVPNVEEPSSNAEAAPPAVVAGEEPAPIEKPVAPPPEAAPPPPPETAAPRSFRTRPQPPVTQPSGNNTPAEESAPQ